MGSLFSKQERSDEELELLNKANLPKPTLLMVRDAREKFKYKFPFYRMPIDLFEEKLEQICDRDG